MRMTGLIVSSWADSRWCCRGRGGRGGFAGCALHEVVDRFAVVELIDVADAQREQDIRAAWRSIQSTQHCGDRLVVVVVLRMRRSQQPPCIRIPCNGRALRLHTRLPLRPRVGCPDNDPDPPLRSPSAWTRSIPEGNRCCSVVLLLQPAFGRHRYVTPDGKAGMFMACVWPDT